MSREGQNRLGFHDRPNGTSRAWWILLLVVAQVAASATVSYARARTEVSAESRIQRINPTNSPPDEWTSQFTWGDRFGGRRQLVTLRCLAGSNCRLTGLNGISEINFNEGIDGSAMIKSPTFAVSAPIPADGGYFEADPGWKTACNPWPECYKKIDRLWMPTGLGNVPLDASRATGAGEWKLGGLLELASRNVRVTLELNYPASFQLRVVWNTYWENRDCLDSTERCAVLPLGGGVIKSQSATTTVRATTTTAFRPTTTTASPTTTTVRPTTTTTSPVRTPVNALFWSAKSEGDCGLRLSWKSSNSDRRTIRVLRKVLKGGSESPRQILMKYPSFDDPKYWRWEFTKASVAAQSLFIKSSLDDCNVMQHLELRICDRTCSGPKDLSVKLNQAETEKRFWLEHLTQKADLKDWRKFKSITREGDLFPWAVRDTDGCSKIFDAPLNFNFSDPCMFHDFLWRNSKMIKGHWEQHRGEFDTAFLQMMEQVCSGLPLSWKDFVVLGTSWSCWNLADTYYAGVTNCGSPDRARCLDWFENVRRGPSTNWGLIKSCLRPAKDFYQCVADGLIPITGLGSSEITDLELLNRDSAGFRINQVFSVGFTLECSEEVNDSNFPRLIGVSFRPTGGQPILYHAQNFTYRLKGAIPFFRGAKKVEYVVRVSSPVPGIFELTPEIYLNNGPCYGARGPNGQVSQPLLQSLEVQVTSTKGQKCRANNTHKKLVAVWREGTSVRWFIRNNADDRDLGIVKWQLVPLRDYEASDTSSPFWKFGTDCDPKEYFKLQYRPSEVASESIANRSFIGGKLTISGGTVGLGLHGVNKSGATVAFEWGFFAERAGGNFWGDRKAQLFEFACKSAAFGSAGSRTVLVTSKTALEAIGVGLAVVDFASSFGIRTSGLQRENLVLELGTLGLDIFLIEQGLDSTGKPVAKVGWNNLSKEEKEWKRKQVNGILIAYGASKAVEWTENASGAPGASLAFTVGMSMEAFGSLFSGQVGTSIGDDFSESWGLCGVYE